jgi:hypothetical protein
MLGVSKKCIIVNRLERFILKIPTWLLVLIVFVTAYMIFPKPECNLNCTCPKTRDEAVEKWDKESDLVVYGISIGKEMIRDSIKTAPKKKINGW